MFPVSVIFLGGKNRGVVDVTTSSGQSTSGWSGVTQVGITQETPSGTTPSAIYHLVSFDNQVTWKVFKSGSWLSVVRNNSGTWQYSNNGSWTNASTNSKEQAIVQATDQSGYQWQKSEVEATSSSSWLLSGGIPSGTYIHWAVRLINAISVTADGTQNTSTDYATNAMSSNSSGGHVTTATSVYSSYYTAYCAFDRGISAESSWGSLSKPTSSTPQSIMIDLGSANAKVINKYQWYAYGVYAINPITWKLQGSNNTSAAVGDAETANGWTTIHDADIGYTQMIHQWVTQTFTNSAAYRFYRFRVTGVYPSTAYAVWITELKLIEAPSTTITPTFTKTTFQYEM